MPATRFARLVRQSCLASLVLIAILPALLAAQLTPEQVVALESVGAVALSPDGRWIAYTLQKPRTGEEAHGPARSELYVVAAQGGAPRVVVASPASASAPSWSSDGATLGFVARLESHHPQAQVYGVPATGGEPRPLTRSSVGVGTFAWSPDGGSIAYTELVPEPAEAAERRRRGDDVVVMSEQGRHTRLWIQPVAGGEPRAITPADRTVRDFAWAPDSRSLALQLTQQTGADADLMFRALFRVPAAGGALSPLTQTEGKLGPMAWSPNGSVLAFLGAASLNDPLAQSVFIARPGAPAVNRTPGFNGSAVWVGWLDSRTILFIAAEGTRTTLNRLDLERGAPQRIAGGGPEVFTTASLDGAARTIALPASTAQHPVEIFTSTLRTRSLRRVTQHNAQLQGVRLARQEPIEWSGADGQRIEGVLIHPLEPPAGGRAPLAILPHGGPEGISYDNWTTNPLYPAQVLAARGYAVLMPNYRASGGRGVDFAKADHRDLGGKEFDDVIRGIDELARRGLIDPDRVGISGTSYGGYFSAWAGTRHSSRFRLAIPFAGLTNWVSFTGTTDIPVEMSVVHWDLWWWDHPGLAWDRSPLAHLATAKTPMLIGHGLADERVHPEQSIELYQALKLKGVPVELVLYPREPHGLRERAHQLDFMRRVVDWFDRYVKTPRPTTE